MGAIVSSNMHLTVEQYLGLATADDGVISSDGAPARVPTYVVRRYDLGLIGGALLLIHDEFGTSEALEETIVGAAKIGAFFGTFLGGELHVHHHCCAFPYKGRRNAQPG